MISLKEICRAKSVGWRKKPKFGKAVTDSVISPRLYERLVGSELAFLALHLRHFLLQHALKRHLKERDDQSRGEGEVEMINLLNSFMTVSKILNRRALRVPGGFSALPQAGHITQTLICSGSAGAWLSCLPTQHIHLLCCSPGFN